MSLKQALSGFLKPFLRAARIDRVEDVADRFRRLDLSGDSLIGQRCEPGDKLQVLVDGDLRTYSPFAFDSGKGSLSLLAFSHGNGPGSRWASAARIGDTVHLFGPRGSLPFRSLPSPVVLVGDETSIGVARALQELQPRATVVLEVNDVAAARAAAETIGIQDVSCVARAAGDTHWDALWSAVRSLAPPDASLVVTGKARTIQALRRLADLEKGRFATRKTKAYWAPGKRGLD